MRGRAPQQARHSPAHTTTEQPRCKASYDKKVKQSHPFAGPEDPQHLLIMCWAGFHSHTLPCKGGLGVRGTDSENPVFVHETQPMTRTDARVGYEGAWLYFVA